jgi:putative ABC transport system permease protein
MEWLDELRRRLSVLLGRDRFDDDLDEEMQFHLELQAEENQGNGMSAEESRYAARRRFGNAIRLKETSRNVWTWPSVESFAQDLRYALRMLRKNPGFTMTAVATLALGIGATTAVFSVVSAVLLRPLPFRDPNRLVMLWETWEKRGESRVVVSPRNFADWKEQSKSFEDMAAMAGGGPAPIQIAAEPTEFPAVEVTGNFFDELGVRPVLGRSFLPEEWRGSGKNVIILGHELWQRLGGNRELLGKTVQMYRELYTVVGIMTPGFSFPNGSEMWLPLSEDRLTRDDHYLRVLGKLKPGVGIAQAQTEMNTIAARLRQLYPAENGSLGIGCTVIGLQEQIVGEARRALLVLFGAVACVLLVACANVANLLLIRAAARGQEIALRVALGASRWRVVRSLLTESTLLALTGGAIGLAGTYWLVRGFVALDPIKLPRIHEIAVDRGVLLFACLGALLTGVLFGLWPALRASRPDLNKALKEGSKSNAAGPLGRSRGRSAMAVAQMALTIVLLTGAALLLRSFVARVSVPLGFRPTGVLGVELPWTAHKGIEQLLERIRALPGVQAIGAGTAYPHEPAGTTADFNIRGRTKTPGKDLEAGKLVITPDYFRAAGMTLRKGRLITGADGASAPKAAVINEALARRYFPAEDPIGKCLQWGDGEWWPIVGVVGNVKGFGVSGEPLPAIYMSHEQGYWGNGVYVLVRTAVPPASLAGAVRKEIRAWNRNLVVSKIATIEDLLSDSVAVPRFYLLLVIVFATLALLVAAVGIYGTINYSVIRRRHEIGVRMALGAERGDVLYMIIRQGFTLILTGVAIGLAASWASMRLMESLLFGVRPIDAAAFAGASIVLVTVGLAASYIPARRATRIDPMEALRHE